MPELKCTVQTCMHNKDFYCDLNAITVGGKSARKAAETSCDSFEERKSGTYSNVTGEAGPTSKIDCKATECQYNKECQCHAGKISVEGSKACSCDECNFQLWMCVDESDGCGRVSPAPVCLCARNERKGAKRMVGEVDGGVRKKV